MRPLDQILEDVSTPPQDALRGGGGVGTLLQNLCKMLFRQKYFYLLKIFGGGAGPPGPMGTTPLYATFSYIRPPHSISNSVH